MLKILEGVVVFSIILYIGERFYMIPFDVPLNMQPIGERSAAYLAKTIGRRAGCIEEVNSYDRWKENRFHVFHCDMPKRNSFSIFIFFNSDTKNQMIKNIKQEDKHSRSYHSCFKSGKYYIICEEYSFMGDKSTMLEYHKKSYRHFFPGYNIVYK